MDSKAYKLFHESFMQNNNGTTAVENFITISPSIFTCFFCIQLLGIVRFAHIPSRFFFEFILLILPTILIVTVLNQFIWQINVACLVITATTIYSQLKGRLHLEPFVLIPARRPEYLTVGRSTVAVISLVAILAVDFQCFPRGLAKTETFGFGLMDTGVGLYVLSNGIVAPDARAIERLSWSKFRKVLLGCVPLVVLGAARFFAITEMDYQLHISEYGVHWNFFLTLAAVRLFGELVATLLPSPDHAKYASITVLCLHEMALQLGLAHFVMSPVPRDNWFRANREGIVSIPGYVALYLIAVYVGSTLRHENEFIRPKELLKKAARVGLIAAFCWKMIYVCERMFGVSRRLANMGYCFWVASIAATMFTLFILLEIFVHFVRFEEKPADDKSPARPPYAPMLFEAINYNALIFFLLGNLLTGLVNLMFQTMLMSTPAGLAVISYYMFTLCAIVMFLFVNRIKLKFW